MITTTFVNTVILTSGCVLIAMVLMVWVLILIEKAKRIFRTLRRRGDMDA